MRIDFSGFTVCAVRSGFSAIAFFAALVLGAPQPGAAQGAVPTTSALTGANSVNGGFNLGCRVVSNVVHGISSGPTGSIAFNDLTTGQSLATASLSSPSVSVSLPFVIPSAFSALPVIADFNNDGFDDIAYWEVHSDTGHNFVDVIYSNGDGTFQPPVQGPDFGSATVGSLVTGKFVSGDRLDLAVQYNNKIVILGSDFAVLTTITTGLSDPLSLVAADFNQDGNTDLAWIDSLGYLQVFLGKGDATFLALAPVQINPSNPGLNPGFAVAATLTSSGFPDLVFSHGTVLLGKGDGTFTTGQSLPTSVTSGWSVIATDLNGDTKQDVVISDGVHAAENDSISVLLGNGDGTFQPPVTYDSSLFTDSDVAWMVAGDFGDAGTDVVIGGRAGLTLFPGNGDGTFGAIQTWATASYAPTNGYEFQSLATGNFSGTGSPGLAGLGFSPSSLGRGFIVWPQSPHQWSASVSLSDVLFTSQFDAAHQVDCSYSGDANYAQSTSTAQSFSYQQAATPAFAPAAGTYPEPLTVRISEGASGAQIYYTVDGSTPTSSSTPYPAGGILVSSSVTVKAIAIGRGWTDSNVASAAYTIMAPPPSAAQPVITPVSGVYSSSQTVTITDSQSAATIHYTIDGSVPTASSPVYSGAFTVNASTVVKAIAVASGYSNSAPAWSAYNFEQQSTTATLTVTGPDPYTMSCSVSGRAINGVSGPSGTVRFTDGLTGATLGTASVGSGTRSRGFGKFPFALRPNDENIYDAVGDFNGDGIADVYRLMVPQVSSSALFYAGNGDGTFSAPVNAQSIGGGIPIPLVTGDFNGDGKLDVAIIGNTLTVMLGNGDGTFQTPVVTPLLTMLSGQYPVYLEKGKFSTGPFDNLLVGLDDGTSQIWLSNGDGSFTFGSTAPGGGAISLRANGRDDLVAEEALLNTHQLVVWLSNPDGSFQAPAYYSAPAGDIVPGVFNNDGHVDLAFISPEKISIVFGNGDGTFQNGNYFTVAPPNRYTFDVAEGVGSMAGYFDGTANLGLAAGLLPINWQTAAPSLAVLNGNSNGTLQTPVVYPGVWIGFGSTAADVNNDGYSDILSVGPGCIFDDCHGSETALYEVLLNEEVADTSASIANITIDPTTASHPLTCSYAGDTSYTGSTSNTVTESFVQLATPVFSLRVGKFTGPQTVSISGSRTGTSYYYTTDGSTPTTSSTLYTGPFVISTTTTLRAIGVQAGYINSNVSEAIYTFAATPQFTPPPGQYSSAQTVTITDSTSGSTIFYTTDGSTPTPLSATYTAPVALPANATLKAMAIAPRHLNSSAASGTYSAPAQTTTTALKASAISVAIGASVTLTATVTGSSPTGSVTFMAGSKALGTVTVSKGAAALKSSFDTAGTYSITANYSGDANNASSSSAAVSITVTAPTPTYTVSATPASQSITAGQSATYKITVTPANGYSASTSFDCSGAPSEAKCSFSPASVAPNGGPVSTTLTISTTAPQAMLDRRPGKDGPPWRPVGSLALAGLVGLFFAPRRARRWRALLRALSCMLLLVSAAMAVTGCGGGGNTGGGQKDTGTPKGSYSVTVNASGTSNQSLKLTLVVK